MLAEQLRNMFGLLCQTSLYKLKCLPWYHAAAAPCLSPSSLIYSSALCLQALTAAALLASPLPIVSHDLIVPFACLDREPGSGSSVGSVPGGARVHAWPRRPQQYEEQ